jgi:hypothetical protein
VLDLWQALLPLPILSMSQCIILTIGKSLRIDNILSSFHGACSRLVDDPICEADSLVDYVQDGFSQNNHGLKAETLPIVPLSTSGELSEEVSEQERQDKVHCETFVNMGEDVAKLEHDDQDQKVQRRTGELTTCIFLILCCKCKQLS